MLILSKDETDAVSFGLTRLLGKTPGDSGNIEVTSEFYTFSASEEGIKQVLSIMAMLEPDPAGIFRAKLSRRSLRILEGYLALTLANLSVKVIPEYERRRKNSQTSTEKDRLSKYMYEAKKKQGIMNALQLKVQKELQSA